MDTPNAPHTRLVGFGNRLVEVHIWLRDALAQLREDVDGYVDGGERPQQLRSHCLTFCSALSRHHRGEDDGMFPVLAEQIPELRPVLEQLRHDHDVVAGLLRSIEDLVGGLGPHPDADEAQRVRGELDGLIALLESHFGYEERTLVAALNALRVPALDEARGDVLLAGADVGPGGGRTDL
jgi:hemerythrin-like domain-containing protein